jgi:hypothetical protein
VRALTRKNYRLWAANALHPSLHFKRIGKPHWSVRVGDHYRAVGMFVGPEFLWQWVGTHEEYNQQYWLSAPLSFQPSSRNKAVTRLR